MAKTSILSYATACVILRSYVLLEATLVAYVSLSTVVFIDVLNSDYELVGHIKVRPRTYKRLSKSFNIRLDD